jgi:hypothetical protein
LAHFDPLHDVVAFEAAWKERSAGAVGEVHAFEPNYEGSPIVHQPQNKAGICSAKGSHQFKARAGHHLAPATLPSGKNVYDLLGPGFTLLGLGNQTADSHMLANAAAALKIPLTVVHEATGSEADRYEATWMLIRPDQFVAWVSHDAHIDAVQARQVLGLITGASSALAS